MGTVAQILIAPAKSAPMIELAEVQAVPGRGLEGDRYFLGSGTFSPASRKPDYELTLIENEQVEAFARQSGLEFTPRHARRNLVTNGIDLNALVNVEFAVGTVRVRGIRWCEPCSHLAKMTYPETLTGLLHKAGLRAQILSEGRIRVGDPIRV